MVPGIIVGSDSTVAAVTPRGGLIASGHSIEAERDRLLEKMNYCNMKMII